MLALLGLGMLTSAFAGALDSLYPVRVVGALAALYWFRGDWLPRSSERGASWQALAIGGLVFVVWIGLSPAADTAHNAAFVRELDALDAWQRYIWLAVRVVGAVVVVPIAEELAFRGYLQRRMLAADFTAVPQERFGRLSLIATALTFGALHASWLAGTFAGLAYALAVYRRGRLADAIAAHATTNALLAAWVVGYQRWDLW
jgi:CAAX prenyl protease-like protein